MGELVCEYFVFKISNNPRFQYLQMVHLHCSMCYASLLESRKKTSSPICQHFFEVHWVALLQQQNLAYTFKQHASGKLCLWKLWYQDQFKKWEVKSFRVQGTSYHIFFPWNSTWPILAMFERRYICQTIIFGIYVGLLVFWGCRV